MQSQYFRNKKTGELFTQIPLLEIANFEPVHANEIIERDCMNCEATFKDDGTHDYCKPCETMIRAYNNK